MLLPLQLSDLVTRIIPHFNKYDLQSSKITNYELWKKCVYIMLNKEHLIQHGLEKIVYYKAIMHNKLSSQLLAAFPNLVLPLS